MAAHATVIRKYAPGLEVTVGSWNARVLTDAMPGARGLWKDACLSPYGGALTIYHVHTYDWEGSYDAFSPFLHNCSDYQLSKQLLVAEYSQAGGAGMTSQQQYSYLFCRGYAGGFGWQAIGTGDDADTLATLTTGMDSLPAPC